MSITEKLATIAENQQKVYDAGYAKGQAEGGGGYEEGYEAGQQAEYDRFWDAYQQNGNRTDYQMAFAGQGWNDEWFKPKYPISYIQSAYGVFAKGCNIKDLSNYKFKVYNAQYMFWQSNVEHIGEIEVTDNVYGIFNGATKLHTVDKLIFADTIAIWTNPFTNCTALENITCEGVISNTLSFSACSKLTDASVQSIIDHLKDLTGQAAQTLTFHATVGGKLTAVQKAAVTAKNWTLVY